MRIDLFPPFCEPTAFARASGAVWQPCGTPPAIRGLCSDSREVVRGDLFAALPGARADGAQYIGDALSRGAAGVLVSADARVPEGNYHLFRADRVEVALLHAAAARRALMRATVVAVGGSAGKTTLKNTLLAMLSAHGTATGSRGNFNSTVGLPLSVLGAVDADFAVFEAGINHPGEMAALSSALSPDLAVLTGIGTAHVGMFGGREALIREKIQLAAGLRPSGTLLLPHEFLPYSHVPRVLTVGGAAADFGAENIAMDARGVFLDLRAPDRVITNLSWPVPSRAGVALLSFAAAAGLTLGCSPREISEGVAQTAGEARAALLLPAGDKLIFADAYNASPESVFAALEALCHLAGDRPRVAVLGAMAELGAFSAELHAAVGAAAADAGLFHLYTYGESGAMARGARRAGLSPARITAFPASARAALVEALWRELPPRAVVLIKGAHQFNMGQMAKEVRERFV